MGGYLMKPCYVKGCTNRGRWQANISVPIIATQGLPPVLMFMALGNVIVCNTCKATAYDSLLALAQQPHVQDQILQAAPKLGAAPVPLDLTEISVFFELAKYNHRR